MRPQPDSVRDWGGLVCARLAVAGGAFQGEAANALQDREITGVGVGQVHAAARMCFDEGNQVHETEGIEQASLEEIRITGDGTFEAVCDGAIFAHPLNDIVNEFGLRQGHCDCFASRVWANFLRSSLPLGFKGIRSS